MSFKIQSIVIALLLAAFLPSLVLAAPQNGSDDTGVILRRRVRARRTVGDGRQPTPATLPANMQNLPGNDAAEIQSRFQMTDRFEPTPTHVNQTLPIHLPNPNPAPAQNGEGQQRIIAAENPETIFEKSSVETVQSKLGGNLGSCLDECQNRCNTGFCGGGCCLQYRTQVTFDAMLVNYHKEGGVAVGIDVNPGDDGADFDLHFAPRITLRQAIDNKYHFKARWFYLSQQQNTIANPNSYVYVENYYIDLLLGRKFCLGNKTELELESGLKWFEFREDLFDNNDTVQFKQSWTKQTGLVFGGLATRQLNRGVSLYLQGYVSYTEGDYYRQAQAFQNDQVNEHDIHSYEASAGFQFDRRLQNGSNLFGRAGLDFVSHHRLGAAFDNGNDETLAGFRDVSLNGFSFRVGWRR